MNQPLQTAALATLIVASRLPTEAAGLQTGETAALAGAS